MGDEADLVWYLAYGSNLHYERFACYVAGGRPAGASRTYLGCRDTTMPRRSEPLTVPGRLVFAGESPTWGGGVAVLRTDGGEVAGRAYLLTRGQLDDVVEQEVGGGSGLYDEVLTVGELDGAPVRSLGTVLHPAPAAPVAAYLQRVVHGLAETFGWDADSCAEYLLGADGVAPAWTLDEVRALHPDSRT